MRPLLQNSAWTFSARVAAQAALGLSTLLIARYLGQTSFGEYAVLTTLVFMANTFTTFGTDMFLIRQIAAQDDLTTLGSVLFLQLLLTSLCLIVSAFLPVEFNALKIYMLTLIPLAFFSVCTAVLRGKQRFNSYALLTTASAFLQLGVVGALTQLGMNLTQLSWGLVGVQVITALFAWRFCQPYFQAWQISPTLLQAAYRASAPIAWLSALGILYQKISLPLLALTQNPHSTGNYAAALRLVEVAKLGHLAIGTALFPQMAKAQSPFNREGLFLVGSAGVIASGLTFSAQWLIVWLFGTEFIEATAPFRVLAWALIPFALNNFLSLYFLATAREKIIRQALTLSLSVLLLSTWVGSSYWDAVGTAAALLVAESLQAILLGWHYLQKR